MWEIFGDILKNLETSILGPFYGLAGVSP